MVDLDAHFDIHHRAELGFPQSLPDFQRLFPDDAACAAYLEKLRWRDGFVCAKCGTLSAPVRVAKRPGVLRSLLAIAGDATSPTYDELYSGEWEHPTFSRSM